MAAFVETAGTNILLKASGFINLAVYYEGFLAAQDGDQRADSIEEEQFKDLIQSQASDLDVDDGKVTADLASDDTVVAVSDNIDDLTL